VKQSCNNSTTVCSEWLIFFRECEYGYYAVGFLATFFLIGQIAHLEYKHFVCGVQVFKTKFATIGIGRL
jgi:hypothetical protein